MSALKQIMTEEIVRAGGLTTDLLVTLYESHTRSLGEIQFMLAQSLVNVEFRSQEERQQQVAKLREEVVITYRNEVMRRLSARSVST